MSPDTYDQKYMLQAIELAEKGIGSVEPNPAVGCIIVKNSKIIGKGYHEKFGAEHAEINAISDCLQNGQNPEGGTMFVTLEPCCHAGKTGPCTEAIIKANITKVLVAMIDPSEHASGKGLDQLQKAGIEIQTGICEAQSQVLNAPFIKFAKTKKPWVILKWAQSKDGFLAYRSTTNKRWISNEISRKDVHKLRRQVQGILVGINTVIADDPLLTARPSKGTKALRLVLDSKLRIPLDCKLLNTKDAPTLIVTMDKTLLEKSDYANQIIQMGAELLAVPKTNGQCDIDSILCELGKNGIQQLLVEGGVKVLTSFIEGNFADGARIYISPDTLANEGGVKASDMMLGLTGSDALEYATVDEFGADKCISGFIKN